MNVAPTRRSAPSARMKYRTDSASSHFDTIETIAACLVLEEEEDPMVFIVEKMLSKVRSFFGVLLDDYPPPLAPIERDNLPI